MAEAKAFEDMTRDRLFGILEYEAETGHFTWKVAPAKHIKAGRRAGSVNSRGYRYIMFEKQNYFEHRLAWLVVTGAWPSSELDHINGDSTDNRIENLRLATRSENLANRRVQKNNRVGVKGVYWREDIKRWAARIQFNRHTTALGFFDSIDEASAAYNVAASNLFGEFARLSSPSQRSNGGEE